MEMTFHSHERKEQIQIIPQVHGPANKQYTK